MKKLLIILAAIGLLTACSAQKPEMVTGPADYVSTLTGTLSHHAFSTGNTYPAIAMPWGMNFWTPDRQDGRRMGIPLRSEHHTIANIEITPVH